MTRMIEESMNSRISPRARVFTEAEYAAAPTPPGRGISALPKHMLDPAHSPRPCDKKFLCVASAGETVPRTATGGTQDRPERNSVLALKGPEFAVTPATPKRGLTGTLVRQIARAPRRGLVNSWVTCGTSPPKDVGEAQRRENPKAID